MKKAVAAVLITLLALAFCACTDQNKETAEKTAGENTVFQTQQDVTEQESEVSETLASSPEGKSSDKQAQKLEKEIMNLVENTSEKGMVSYPNGHFVYLNVRDAQSMYSQERSEEGEKTARNLADKIAEATEPYYGEMKKIKTDIKNVGSSDNGIDSVLYNFYYESETGGQMRIQVDSDGVVSYIESKCSFV